MIDVSVPYAWLNKRPSCPKWQIHGMDTSLFKLGICMLLAHSSGNDRQIERKLTRLAHRNTFLCHDCCNELCRRNVERGVVYGRGMVERRRGEQNLDVMVVRIRYPASENV